MKTYLILLFTSALTLVNAQKIEIKFKIDSIANGSKLFLNQSFIQDYYPEKTYDSAFVNNGKVSFLVDKQSFSYPYELTTEVINKSYFNTRPFYLKDKPIDIKLNQLHDQINNDINERESYENYFKNINSEIDKYNNYYGENFIKYKFDFPKEINDSINNWYHRNWMNEVKSLEQYIKENPKSEIALWKIIEKFKVYRDYPYENLLAIFDSEIKKTYPFIVLTQKIQDNKTFGIGKSFPTITNLKTTDGKQYQSNYTKNKYTLIDFWFSSCKPCLVTFPKLKEIYNIYQPKGFEIEAVSTDTGKNIEDWKRTIIKYNLPWINVLDENKNFSNKNNINSFPTSFLVDQNGKIIKKDITPEELEKFLKENLN